MYTHLTKRIKELEEVLRELTGFNLPTYYWGEDDEIGECPYCGTTCNSYKPHSDNCPVVKAEKLLKGDL